MSPRRRSPCPASKKTLSDIRKEWDAAAETRARQVRDETDLSFHRVLMPTLLQLAQPADRTAVIDIGCGTGYLTHRLARQAGRVVGIDVSVQSIALAQREYAANNLNYVAASVERFARHEGGQFSLAVANMTLMTAPNLRSMLAATSQLLKPGALFVFTITHPWFWPVYWGYSDKPWFSYTKEVAIEAPLRISLDDSGAVTTHYHRPLSRYVAELRRASFDVELIEEPMPSVADERAYPERWRYPRFLAARCVRLPVASDRTLGRS